MVIVNTSLFLVEFANDILSLVCTFAETRILSVDIMQSTFGRNVNEVTGFFRSVQRGL